MPLRAIHSVRVQWTTSSPRAAEGDPDWFWSNDMAVDEVMTDNGPNFVSDVFAELLAKRRIRHRRTRPYRPQPRLGGGAGHAELLNR